ncbi:MAG: IclR family transcriptional regulator [Chloroflexota bacterium]|nr:IclR family transcriptional regulator [Chloroflexota bacterium]
MTKPSSTLRHAIALMDCFSKDEPYLGVREAARMTGIPSSTTGRTLASLKELGLLVQDSDTRQYALAGKVLAWAEIYTATVDVRRVAQPFIYDLQRLTGETISLYILEGNERVCVERLESEQNVRMVARVGRYLPLHAGSAGKLFLAFMSEDQRESILADVPREAFTDKTITDADELRRQCEIIQKRGFALSHGEWTADASGVAAPIFNQRRQMVAALTVSGPTQRFTEDKVDKFAQTCIRTALQISRLLGYNPSQHRHGVQPGRHR